MKDELRKGADRVTSVLREAGFQAYLAGGCVRDQLLGRTPKDYDIVTDARPEQVVKLFKRTIEVGAAFGVVKVLLSRDRDYEVATFRTEGTYSDGRRPDEVIYSDDWREDVARRDLTINALLMNAETDEILDAVNGRRDLEAGIIRAVGEPARRFEEDKLRMLRAVRFAARFDFALDEETRAAIQAGASALSVVSKERIVAELEGIFRGHPGVGFRLLESLGLLGPALPHVSEAGRSKLVERMQRLEVHAAELSTADKYAVGWAVTVDGLDRKQSEKAMKELKLSREAIRVALRLQEALPQLQGAERFDVAPVMRFAASEDADRLLAYFQVMLGGEDRAVARFTTAQADLSANPLPPRPAVTGDDLKALGMQPSRAFKDILQAVDDAVLERRVTDRAQALVLAKSLAVR